MVTEKQKYYSLDKILDKKCTYNVIFGERSNGKTYSVLKYAIQKYFKGCGQLAIVRRWKEDISGRRASDIFNAIKENNVIAEASNGRYQGITYWAGKFYFCNYDETNNNKPVYSVETDCFAYCFALSDAEHNKSISYPRISTILFDEFLTKHTYFPDEFILFMNTISTIIRQRKNVEIFMLGNTVNKFCPYFGEMGLTHIKDMKQGDIDVYTYGDSELKVAVEYCANIKSKKSNNFYFAFDNPKLNMITKGAWELDIYPHCPVKYKPKDIIFTYFIVFNKEIFQCEIVHLDTMFFTFIHIKTSELKDVDSDIIYTLDYSPKLNYHRNILRPVTEWQQKIAFFFKTDKVFYQNNEVGDCISNYLKICRME